MKKQTILEVMQAYALSHNIKITGIITECYAMLKYAHPGFPESLFKAQTLNGIQNKQTITIVFKDAANMTHCQSDHVLEKITQGQQIITPPTRRVYYGAMAIDFI